ALLAGPNALPPKRFLWGLFRNRRYNKAVKKSSRPSVQYFAASSRTRSSLDFISSATVLPAVMSTLNLPLLSSSRKCLRSVFSSIPNCWAMSAYRSVLDKRALSVGRHIFGWHFPFRVAQLRDARALY